MKKYRKMDCIRNRRTIRKYDCRDVDEALLCRLLEEAERTQTMGNMQLYSVVMTRDEEMKGKLSPCHFNQPMVKEAPAVLTFCADFQRATTWCRLRKADPGYDNFLSFMNAATDALLYCQTFCTLAEAEGLGVCYLGTTLYTPSQIAEVLSLPSLVMPVATVTVGWPAEHPPQTDRLPLSAVLHRERYVKPGAAEIDRDYAAKEALPENREFVRLNGKETLAQIFTGLRYTRRDNESMSRGMLEALCRQGFLSVGDLKDFLALD